ncbi:MAG: serine dehydrogenasease [Rhodocyclaceae bacterium]|nr:serine dehydrogenasease [Dechloromonas sp.]TEX44412.1 MAG: serine dehydrogenasease [Rhodocyclaceae bacterium]
MRTIDRLFQAQLKANRSNLESHFEADLIGYYGEISSAYLPWFRQRIEVIGNDGAARKERLITILNTPGGEVEAVERMVEMQRHFYKEVYFVVPNMAMSAGTIFCMSGDKIFMDYSSSLGPIDPQVQSKDGKWVPALGYLDKFEEILQKSRANTLTSVEFSIAQNQDLAELRRYEQARDLSVSLLKTWLIEYKFRSWDVHRSDTEKKGQPVTQPEKEQRAADIAQMLGSNREWHSHGRRIGINTLRSKLRLEIEDYSADADLRNKINEYHDLISDYMNRQNYTMFIDVSNDK